MRNDPNWADHAREDWIFEQHEKQERLKNGNIDGRANNNQGAGVHGKTPVLLEGGITNSLPVIL